MRPNLFLGIGTRQATESYALFYVHQLVPCIIQRMHVDTHILYVFLNLSERLDNQPAQLGCSI